jgi:hypothetical protein
MALIRWVVVPSIACALLAVGLALVCRRVTRTSPRFGAILTIGLTLQIGLAMVLFWTSYLELPFGRSLQFGPGFWRMAIDARSYHTQAMYIAESGRSGLPLAPSPAYVAALSAWMRVMGVSPFSAVLFNATCYTLTCLLVIGVLRGLPTRADFERVGTIVLVAVTASPMLLFVSTQALKDSFFLLFALMLSVGTWWVASVLRRPGAGWPRQIVPGLLALSVGVYVTSGVRAYYPVIAGCAGGLMWVAAAVQRGSRRLHLVAQAALVSAVVLVSLILGAEDLSLVSTALDAFRAPTHVVAVIDTLRNGFVSTGGATNVAGSSTAADETKADGADVGDSPRPAESGAWMGSITGRLKNLLLGLTTLFIPITVLRALSLVDVRGNWVMVAVGDIDTVYFDCVLVAIVFALARLSRRTRPNIPYLVFGTALTLVLIALMPYVVTNVGTLVRLRLMLLAPLLSLTFAFARMPDWRLSSPANEPRQAESEASARSAV